MPSTSSSRLGSSQLRWKMGSSSSEQWHLVSGRDRAHSWPVLIFCHACSSAIEQAMQPYVNPFLEPLLQALQSSDDSQLCTVAVGVIGDICRALGDSTETYSQGFMGALLQTLQSTTLNRNVKISVLSCFGDIALAIGAKFEPYLEHTMTVLKQAGELTADEVSILSAVLLNWHVALGGVDVIFAQTDYDMIDYVQSLREGIVEAYVGIVTALKSGGKGTDNMLEAVSFGPTHEFDAVVRSSNSALCQLDP